VTTGANEGKPARPEQERVAFLGPEGTFSEEALFASADRELIEPVPKATVYDCVMAVQQGEAERAIVPIENSLEGSVNATLDALAFETDRVVIAGEVVHPIQHCLIARTDLPLERIERVLSHPQASAQCSTFIRARLPQAVVVPADSTADAVRLVAASSEPWAALGTRLSAELYGCRVLETGVENIAENETRFVWLATTQREEQAVDSDGGGQEIPEGFKTSVVFWGLEDHPGALVGILQQFARRQINLTKIESRPRKLGLGRYIFFVDLEGHERGADVVSALDSVRAAVETLRVLGCYPAARPTAQGD
jgi:prephenate dehydratase